MGTLKRLDSKLLEPTGIDIEKWELEGCTIIGYDFGKLDYSDDSIVECGITILPKKAILVY
jgi:hypothetical protein